MICLQNNVTFNCTGENVKSLEWRAAPFIASNSTDVIFLPNDMQPTRMVVYNGVVFHAELTHSELVQGTSTLYTLQSTLSTTASTINSGTVIECIDHLTGASNSAILQLEGQFHLLRLTDPCLCTHHALFLSLS